MFKMQAVFGNTSIRAAVLCAALLATSGSNAATISADPAISDGLGIGERVTLNLLGSDFVNGSGEAGSAGGGLDISWDPTVVTIASLDDVELLFPRDISESKGQLDNALGSLRDLSTVTFNPVQVAEFDIARVTFTTVGAGSTLITLDIGTPLLGGRNVWGDVNFIEIDDLNFAAASVTAVPLPPSIILIAVSLGLLRTKRRNLN